MRTRPKFSSRVIIFSAGYAAEIPRSEGLLNQVLLPLHHHYQTFTWTLSNEQKKLKTRRCDVDLDINHLHWRIQGGGALAPKISSKSCCFHSILKKNFPILGSGTPLPWGQNSAGSSLTKILDPSLTWINQNATAWTRPEAVYHCIDRELASTP